MSKKTKRASIVIDDIPYKQLKHTNINDSWWKNVPQIPLGNIGSGIHIIEKNRQNSHWDIYNGAKKIDMKKIEGKPPKFRSMIVSLKGDGIFAAPSENHISVLRGQDKPMGWISPEHYRKNKNRYRVEMGIEDNPDVVVEIFEEHSQRTS